MRFGAETTRVTGNAVPKPARTSKARMAFFGIGLVLGGAPLLAFATLGIADGTRDIRPAMSHSAGYGFGYAAAARAVCHDIDLDTLTAGTPKDPAGRIADDIAQGFSAFSREYEVTGMAGACSAAARLVRIRQ